MGVTALRFWVIRYGVIAASRGGKVKTALQIAGDRLVPLAAAGGPGRGRPVVMGAAVMVTVVTGVDYVVRAMRLRRRGLSLDPVGAGSVRLRVAHAAQRVEEPMERRQGRRARRQCGRSGGARPGRAAGDPRHRRVADRWPARRRVVEVAGASRVFRGGLVVYATEMKAMLAGVPQELLRERGPVDPDVARALAEGGRKRCLADWCAGDHRGRRAAAAGRQAGGPGLRRRRRAAGEHGAPVGAVGWPGPDPHRVGDRGAATARRPAARAGGPPGGSGGRAISGGGCPDVRESRRQVRLREGFGNGWCRRRRSRPPVPRRAAVRWVPDQGRCDGPAPTGDR